MAIKKSELYSSLWKSCDELRGGMDASQYKDYVLVLLFVKYVSDKYAGQPEGMLEVPEGGGFADMVALKGDKEIGDKINKIIGKLAEANDLKGVIDVADFNDDDKLGKGKDMVDRLSNLVSIFDTPSLDFKENRAEGDDILGDAYEYLMRHFATESGKSKGQFYTPAEVSRIMAKVIGIGKARNSDQTIYDPTCGSGSLLLKAHDEAKGKTGFDLAIYGQENDNATKALAKMNMILHDCPTAEIWKDNTLAAPYFKESNGGLKRFDFAVANPPFSTKAWSNGFDPLNDLFGRFTIRATPAVGEDAASSARRDSTVIPPAKNGDYAFLLHIIASLKSSGKGAVILPHGVLFRGNAEADIRRHIVRQGYIKGIIGLPANLFYGTGIPACIIVLDKENAGARKGIFMIDASKAFIKDGNKNRLRAQDIHKIVDTFNRQIEIARYSRMVPLEKIEENEFNLNIPRYVDSTEPEDLQDIEAHLRGGIPKRDIDALESYWKVFPAVRATLFTPSPRDGYSDLCVKAADIKTAIFGHEEFTRFNQSVTALFSSWKTANTTRLKNIAVGDHPKELIESLAEDLLETFRGAALLDHYDVYQHLLNYWADTMQDDLYALVADGWESARTVELIGKKGKVTDVRGTLIPTDLVIARYFAAERDVIQSLEAEQEALSQQMTELIEETGGEESPLEQLRGSKGITKGSVQDRVLEVKAEVLASTTATAQEKKLAQSIKKDFAKIVWTTGVKDEAELFPELDILHRYLLIFETEAELKAKIRTEREALFKKVVEKYATMSVDELKTLLVEDKWMTTVARDVDSELDRVSQALAGRIKQLAGRYETPLPKLAEEVASLSTRVEEHLRKMGASWN